MLSRKRFHKINDFYLDFLSCIASLVRFSIKIDVLILAFTESLCLVLLRQPETSLILWLHGSGSIKRAALFGKFTNVVGLGED